MSNKKNNFLVQGSILAISSVICRIIGILYRVPLNNIIGDTGMGYYNAAFEVYSILLIISSYSLPLAVSKLVSARIAAGEYKNAYTIFRYARSFAIIVGLVVGSITLVGADLFVAVTKYSKSALALRTLAPTLLIMSVVGVYRGFYQGLGTMMPTAVSNIFEQIMNAIISVVAAYTLFHIGINSGKQLEFGAAGGTIGTGAGALTAFVFLLSLYFVYKKVLRKQIKKDTISETRPMNNVLKVLIMTIVPVILSTTVYNISGLLDGAIFGNISFYKGIPEEAYTDLYGIYSAKYRTLMNVPIAIAASLASSIIPSLIASLSVKDMKSLKRKIDYSIRFSMIIAIPCAIGLAVLAKPILMLLYPGLSSYSTPVTMMQLGAISVVFYSLSTITNSVLQGTDFMRIPVIHASASVVVHIILLCALMLIFNMSINAVVISDAFFALFICILNSFALRKHLGFRQEYFRTFLLPGISGIIMGVFTFVVYKASFMISGKFVSVSISNLLSMLLAVFVAIFVYAIALLVLRVVSEDELMNLPKGHKIVAVLSKFHLV